MSEKEFVQRRWQRKKKITQKEKSYWDGSPEIIGFALSVIVIKPKMKFIFSWIIWSKYATIRDNFYKKIQPIIQNVSRLPVPDLILELMNSSDYFVIMQLIKFISSFFDSRNKVLSM